MERYPHIWIWIFRFFKAIVTGKTFLVKFIYITLLDSERGGAV